MDMKWQRGEFIKFFAKMKIRVGGSPNSYTIEKGDEFEFDGTMCKYAGSEFAQMGLRSAIRDEWASVSQDDVKRVASFQPGREIASATSINRDLSRVQRQRSSVDVDDADEDTVLEISDRQTAMKDPSRGHIKASDNRRLPARGMSVQSNLVDDQEGVVVSSIKTPTRAVVDVSKNPGKARELEMATYEDGYGNAGSNMIHREGVSIKTNTSSMRGASIMNEDEQDKVVGTVRGQQTQHREGVEIKDTSNIRDTPKRRVVTSAVVTSNPVVESDDSVAPSTGKLDLARSICADFPSDWNFFAKSEVKLQRVEELGGNPQLVKALLAAESKAFKKLLVQKYPK